MAPPSLDATDSFHGQKRTERETDSLSRLSMMLRISGSIPSLLTNLSGLQRHKFTFTLDRDKNASHRLHVGIRGYREGNYNKNSIYLSIYIFIYRSIYLSIHVSVRSVLPSISASQKINNIGKM